MYSVVRFLQKSELVKRTRINSEMPSLYIDFCA